MGLEWEIGCVQDRICSTKKGSITSVQAIYVPADDLTDPAPATTFQHLDATTVLSRKISKRTMPLPTSLPFWGWTSCQKRTRPSCSDLEKWRNSRLSLSPWLNSLLV